MKQYRIYILALLALTAFLLPSDINAQDKEGNITVSFGAGYSLKYGFIVPNNSSYSIESYDATPVYTGAIDFASIDKLSIGLAASYQTVKAEGSLGYYGYYGDDGVYYEFFADEPLTEQLNILNVGVRIQYHFLPKVEKVDLYTGGRIGMTFWDYSSNVSNPAIDAGFDRLLKEDNNLPTFQLGFGMRYYATDWFGLNIEGMIGNGPYSMLLGANFKFGGAK